MASMTYPSKPLVLTLEQYRERPANGKAWGWVHLVLNIKWARKRTETLCGLGLDGMQSQGTPFSGWAEVLCNNCAEAIAM